MFGFSSPSPYEPPAINMPTPVETVTHPLTGFVIPVFESAREVLEYHRKVDAGRSTLHASLPPQEPWNTEFMAVDVQILDHTGLPVATYLVRNLDVEV